MGTFDERARPRRLYGRVRTRSSRPLSGPYLGRGNTIALRIAGDPTRGDEPVAALQARIAADPDAAEPRFAYAVALEDLGRMTAAHRAYVEVLERDPVHLGALTNLGSILHGAGARDVAREFYTKAVVEHPSEW